MDILITREHRTGRITLNRPKALNALSWAMVREMHTALLDWKDDAEIDQVLVDAMGDKAFCAGGDIIEIYEEGKSGSQIQANQFWRDEYRLNALIATYPKPYVAVMDGYVMGGGVGISAHGSHRIVTERTGFAMPECVIGLNPDVGGSLILARLAGHLGEYCGLTGARLNGTECRALGLATHFVPSDRLEHVKRAVINGDLYKIEDTPPTPSTLLSQQDAIDHVFGQRDLAAILSTAKAHPELPQVQKALDQNAPLAMSIALRTIRSARGHGDIHQTLIEEYRGSSRALVHGEMVEGIRAAVIDKDKTPRWKYPNVADIPPHVLEMMTAPAEGGDMEF